MPKKLDFELIKTFESVELLKAWLLTQYENKQGKIYHKPDSSAQ